MYKKLANASITRGHSVECKPVPQHTEIAAVSLLVSSRYALLTLNLTVILNPDLPKFNTNFSIP